MLMPLQVASRAHLSEQSCSEDDDVVSFAVSNAHITGPFLVFLAPLYDITHLWSHQYTCTPVWYHLNWVQNWHYRNNHLQQQQQQKHWNQHLVHLPFVQFVVKNIQTTKTKSWPSSSHHVLRMSKHHRPKRTLAFSNIFPKLLRIFSPNFTLLLHVPVYARLQIFIQSPTVTKLCRIKCNHPACVSVDGGHFAHI